MAIHHGQTMHVHEDYKVQQEFERLGNTTAKIGNVVETIFPDTTVAGSGIDPVNPETREKLIQTIWALTVEHNNREVAARTVQDLNFNDNVPPQKYKAGIRWDLVAQSLSGLYATIKDAKKVNFEAEAHINPRDFFTWLLAHIKARKSVTSVLDYDTDELFFELVGDEYTPGYEKYYGTNELGSKGFHTFQYDSIIKIPFAYNNKTPASTAGIPTNSLVKNIYIHITTAFDAGTFTLSRGLDTLVGDTDIDIGVAGKYNVMEFIEPAASGSCSIAITGSPTVGAGTAYVLYGVCRT